MIPIDDISKKALSAIQSADTLDVLEPVRLAYLGKKGELTQILKSLSKLSLEEKKSTGQAVNRLKSQILELYQQRKDELQHLVVEQRLRQETIDVTLPGRHSCAVGGHLHPVTRVKRRIARYFTQLGFEMVEGPEVETEFYNFEALNIPSHHPARAMHDTFYFDAKRLLRTHTSPVQIRSMEQGKPPFRLIAPGRVYRCDSDLTHTPMFHQVEGLLVDEKITFASLKWILNDFFQYFFEQSLSLRFRPSYFPFTEPSAEVDISCTQCDGKGCRVCSHTGWLEVLGCGMVHPKVLASVSLDANVYSGWAFGMGIDRLAMLKYGISDLRLFFESDVRFLRQF